MTWASWQRSEDYYAEGELIWLDADTKIRELTDGKKSLDDFAKLFLGEHNGSFITSTYRYDDVLEALNTVVPFDWGSFLRQRIYELRPAVPLDGFTRGGYKLVYSDAPIPWVEKAASEANYADFSTSLGLSIRSADEGSTKNAGTVSAVWWNGPAFKAGVTPNMQLIAVNQTAYTAEVLRSAIVTSERDIKPIKLILLRGKQLVTISVNYHGGLRYPSLQRVDGTPARLDDILAPSNSPLPSN